MSDSTWQADLLRLLEERIGVRLRADDPQALENFVNARVRALNLSRPSSYVNYLRAEARDGTEFSRLSAACTHGQTSFYRGEPQLRAAVQAVRQLFEAQRRPLWIWSAGCATGEEPYSLALLLYQTGLPAYIVATDISSEALAAAQKAVYFGWSLRNVPQEVRDRFFAQQEDRYILKDKVRNMVEVRQHNLVVDPLPPPRGGPAGWDIILCRNVLLYYPSDTVDRVLTHMAAALHPDGWLFVGAGDGPGSPEVPVRADEVGGCAALRRRGPTAVPPAGAVTAAAPPPPTRRESTTEAIALLTSNEREAAIALLEELTAGQPNNVLAWLLLGHAWLHQHDFERALEAYTRAQARAPLLAEVHYFQGVVHRKVNNLDPAEQALRRALYLEPNYWPASYLLAGIYDRQGRPSLSRRELTHTQNAIRANPATPFRSHVAFNPALRLTPSEVMSACTQRLTPTKRG